MKSQTLNLRAIAEFLVVAVCTATFAFTALGIGVALMGRDAAGSRDFVEYWAAGQQIIHGANPYDDGAIYALERSAGFPSGVPTLIMANPPSALLLVLPLGVLGPRAGEMLWEILLLASLILSVRLVRTMHGNPKNLKHLLAFAFAPVLSCLLSGQVSIFVLLGLVLFLKLHRSHPFAAGASLWLCMLKPHLFLPFGLVLMVWIFVSRSYKVLAGTLITLGLSSAIATILNPQIWDQYLRMMGTERVDRGIIPCFSAMLRLYVPPHTLWLQCLPMAIGCAWALAYFRKHREDWDWIEHGSLLLLASVFVAPYTWFMDQAVLVPALLHAAFGTRSRTLIATLALMSAVIEIEILRNVPLLHSAFYAWTTPAWLAWYLITHRAERSFALHELSPDAGTAI